VSGQLHTLAIFTPEEKEPSTY